MSAFLDLWDEAINRAVKSGRTACVTTIEETQTSKGKLMTAVVHARTRHPLFMGATPPKLDPERDK